MRRSSWGRVPFLLLAVVALVAGLWGGLLRLGLPLPVPSAWLITDHGGLMVSGFLGTLIGVDYPLQDADRLLTEAFAAPVPSPATAGAR